MRYRNATRLLLSTIIVLISSTILVTAQDSPPSTLSDPDSVDAYSPKRKPNGEWILGWMTSAILFDSTETQSEFVHVRSFFQFGYGGAIPLTELGTISTLWLKFAAQVGLSIQDDNGDPDVQADLSIPVHAVFGYGALRRKSVAWGGSVGLGLNIARRFQYDAFTFAPSLLAEVQYSPRNVYGLRLLMDLLPGSIDDNIGYHTWSIQFFAGL